MLESITAQARRGNKEPVIAGLILLKRGWYDISAPDRKIKYIFYPGSEVYKDPFYKEDKKRVDDNISFITSLIKEKLFKMPPKKKEGQSGDLIRNKPQTYTIDDLDIGALKTYDISTVYKGEEFMEGVTAYRKDGSILYGIESEAYRRIWEMTLFTGNEEMAIIGSKTVLVLPSYFNDSSTGYTKDYGYTFTNGNLNSPFLGILETIATVHTHPSGEESPSTWAYDGYGDLGIASFSTPLKPAYVFALNEKLTISLIISNKNTANTAAGFNKYKIEYLTRNFPDFNIKYISSGKYSLRDWTLVNKKMLIELIK